MTEREAYFTYAHCKQTNGSIFYIGKGKRDRIVSHASRNNYWKNVVSKHGLRTMRLAKWKTEQEAFDHERFLIWCFKDMGIELVNMTDGGEGLANPSAETKEKMSNSFKGRRYSYETRKRMSQSRKRYFENMTDAEYENYCNKMRICHTNKLNVFPAYNKNSILMIEDYGKKNGYNFQHAENGGEYFIKELGYWVDAYDKEKNVVLEIDEQHHFVNGRLRLKDIVRQKRIERHLNCKFNKTI